MDFLSGAVMKKLIWFMSVALSLIRLFLYHFSRGNSQRYHGNSLVLDRMIPKTGGSNGRIYYCLGNNYSCILNRSVRFCLGIRSPGMTPKERMYAVINGLPYDRPAVTPIFMAW